MMMCQEDFLQLANVLEACKQVHTNEHRINSAKDRSSFISKQDGMDSTEYIKLVLKQIQLLKTQESSVKNKVF